MQEHTGYLPGLSPIVGKQIDAAFDGGMLSSNAGVLLLREVGRRLGVADRLAACLPDRRDPAPIDHTHHRDDRLPRDGDHRPGCGRR